MSECAAATGLRRQSGLGAVQRLDLALFIETKNDGILRWSEINPTTSVSFSRNLGSRESLKLLVRCGLS